MAHVRIQETPADSMDTYDQVNAKMGVDDNPPAGMLVHSAGMSDGKMVIVDVWESREAAQRFEEERLMPAIREVMGGDPPEGAGDVRWYEAHNLLRP